MSSRAAPASAMPCAADTTADLWAKAAELERDFAGYKRRLAERREHAVAVAGGAEEERGGSGGGGDEVAGRGRRYEEYVRRRDERLRHEWRARMERKEAEMKALWARLDLSGSRRGGDGELTAASVAGEEKPGNLAVKVKPAAAPVAPRCSPAAKLSRPRTSVPSSPAAASPKLSTPDARRRASHSQRGSPQAVEPPATPRKDNRLPIASTVAAAPAPGTPRPRTMMSRSRTMLKDRGCSSVGESPRPPRLQPPRSSCDGGSNHKESARTPDVDAIAAMQNSPSFSEHAVVAELFHLRRSGNGAEPTPSPLVPPRDEPNCGEIARAGGNAGNKTDGEQADRSSDKFGSVEITGDSDTEPSYVYIKKDSDEQAPRPSRSPALVPCPATASDGEPISEEKDIAHVEEPMVSPDANAVAGEAPAADAEEASRRESSESLYSNVQSSFSRGSELDASATNSPLRSPPPCSTPPTVPSPEADAAAPRLRNNPEVEEEEAEKISVPIPSTPVSGVTVSITVQTPMDAVAGLRRFLTFGKRNGRAGEVAAAVVQRAPHAVAPAGDPVKATLGSPDAAASDDKDNSYVISPHVGPSKNSVPSDPANAERKEAVLQAKSPRVHRSFFPFASFKSRAN